MSVFSSGHSKSKKPQLKAREWGAIALILGFLAAISLISHFSQVKQGRLTQEYIPLAHRTLEIDIQGAIERPGIYTCKPGIQLKSLLDKAGIKRCANRRKIPFKKVLFSSQSIHIDEKSSSSRQPEKISLEEN